MLTPEKTQPEILQPAKKPSLVLIHGFRGAPSGLETIARDLKKAEYKVYVPAIPPFANAPELPDYTPDSYADFLANYIREHQLERPVLIGHSMGSIVAAATASKHPELVHHKLILLAPISDRTPKLFSLIAPLQNFVPRKFVDYVTTRYLFVPHDRKLFREVMKLTNECSGNHPPKRQNATAATKFSTRNCIDDFRLPQNILLLTGKNDRVVSPRKTNQLAQKLGAQTVYLENSGHLHNYEKPHETATVIIDFLEKSEKTKPQGK